MIWEGMQSSIEDWFDIHVCQVAAWKQNGNWTYAKSRDGKCDHVTVDPEKDFEFDRRFCSAAIQTTQEFDKQNVADAQHQLSESTMFEGFHADTSWIVKWDVDVTRKEGTVSMERYVAPTEEIDLV